MRLFFLLSWLFAAAVYAVDGKRDPFIDAVALEADVKAMQGQVDPAIRLAVADAMKAEVPPTQNYQSTPAFSSANTDIMTAAFIGAKVPDCLHSEGMKRQFTFFLGGYLALPFIPIAKLRGKCN